jgi:ferrochelatase
MDNGKTAVILINMGGPENLEQVRSFLFRLFNDRHILNIPQPLRAMAAGIITAMRTPDAKSHYFQIGGSSPLKKWTSRQADLVLQKLADQHPGLIVKCGYSYAHPLIAETIGESAKEGVGKIVAVPLYPHYSGATLGSVYYDLEKARKKFNLNNHLRIVSPFFDNRDYIRAGAVMLKSAMEKIDAARRCRVIFSAHALPQSLIDRGDPYQKQVEKNVALLLGEVPVDDFRLAYQSKIGPVKWIKPSTKEAVQEAGRDGIKQLIVFPVSFVCDHIETLHELDIELSGIAREAGIEIFIRAPVFNDSEPFINMLASLIGKALK